MRERIRVVTVPVLQCGDLSVKQIHQQGDLLLIRMFKCRLEFLYGSRQPWHTALFDPAVQLVYGLLQFRQVADVVVD